MMTKEQKLLNRWLFDLANQLIDEGWTRKEAFKQAYLTRRLLECLGMGTVVFEYYKKDGSVRRARGTLCKGVSKDFDNYEYKTESWGEQSWAPEAEPSEPVMVLLLAHRQCG